MKIRNICALPARQPITLYVIVRLAIITLLGFFFAEMLYTQVLNTSQYSVSTQLRQLKETHHQNNIYLSGIANTSQVSSPKNDNIITIVNKVPTALPIPTIKGADLRNGIETVINKDEALIAGNRRNKKGFLTLGIPTVHRDKGSYLIETIQSLIHCMTEIEQNETVIVVFLADFEKDLKQKTLDILKNKFLKYMDTGLLQVIHAPKSFYPPLDGLKRTYNHPEQKVKWRSKQNYDYAFMFKYSTDLSEYYMQLEDDVLTVRNFIQITKDYIKSQKGNWVCLELSELGYIGKLYHSYDLEQLAKMMMLFFQEQPPDVTFIYFNILLLQFQRIIRVPTIFQHMGYHSSLSGKVQPLKDSKFDDISKQYDGDNPPASIFTNFTIYEPYKPEFAYAKYYGYFWAKKPTVNSYYMLVFDRPERISKIMVTTGSKVHDKDILRQGVLEVSPTLIKKTETSAECANFVYAGNFNKSGTFEVTNVRDFFKFDIFCIRIRMTGPQIEWIIFREIAIFLLPR